MEVRQRLVFAFAAILGAMILGLVYFGQRHRYERRKEDLSNVRDYLIDSKIIYARLDSAMTSDEILEKQGEIRRRVDGYSAKVFERCLKDIETLQRTGISVVPPQNFFGDNVATLDPHLFRFEVRTKLESFDVDGVGKVINSRS